MTFEGGLVGAAMVAPPIVGYFLLRRGGRRPWGALLGAIILLLGCVVIAFGVTLFADRHGISLDAAMWFYPVVIVALLIALWRKYGR